MAAHTSRKLDPDPERERVQSWCDEHGIMRYEVEIGRKFLPRHNLNGWVNWCDERACELAERYNPVDDVGVGVANYQEVGKELEALGLKPARARNAQHAVYAWLAGEDLRQTMSKSSFYRVTADLSLVGIDARVPCEVSRIGVAVRTVTVRPACRPGWYRGPAWGPALAA